MANETAYTSISQKEKYKQTIPASATQKYRINLLRQYSQNQIIQ